MEKIDELISALPKEDVSKAFSLLKKKDYFNLSYLVWADLSRVKRGDAEADIVKLEELNSLLSKAN